MSVTVTGRGSASAAPDVAHVDLSVAVRASSPDAALAGASRSLAAVREALRAGGLPDAAVRTRDLGVRVAHDREGRPEGYEADTALAVRVDDLDGLGALLADAVRAGGEASRLDGVRLAVHDLHPVRREAREAAWAEARSAAEQLAALAGRRLGPVTEVVDGEVRPGPEPRRHAAFASGGPDVDPGRLDVAHAVTVTWDLA